MHATLASNLAMFCARIDAPAARVELESTLPTTRATTRTDSNRDTDSPVSVQFVRSEQLGWTATAVPVLDRTGDAASCPQRYGQRELKFADCRQALCKQQDAMKDTLLSCAGC